MPANDYTALKPSYAPDEIVDTILARGVYVLNPLDDVQTLEMGNARILALEGRLYAYDPADVVSAHDGIAVLVDFDGKRFKLVTEIEAGRVEDILVDPPVSPQLGQAWIVDAAATGAWAGQDASVATWTALGWRFTAPRVSMTRYSVAALGFYHYSASGAWVVGLGSQSIATGGISSDQIAAWGGFAVEGEVNAPPGSPVDGDFYLVGVAPSGDFLGEAGSVAARVVGAWIFLPPYEGAEVYDKAGARKLFYEGGSWSPAPEFAALEFIASHDFDAVPQDVVNVIDLSAFIQIEIWGSGFIGSGLRIRVSTDEGSTFDDGVADYLQIGGSTASSAGLFFDDRADRVTLHNFNKAASTLFQSFSRAFARDADEVNNAIRIFNAGAGDVTAGKLFIYGVRG